MKKIKCQLKKEEARPVAVKVVKAPLFNPMRLRRLIFTRAKALVL